MTKKVSYIFLTLAMASALLCLASCASGKSKVRQYKVKVVNEYPHDVTSYTQGLFFMNGEMIETTGQWGESTLRKVDLASGKALRKFNFDDKYFLEGSVCLDGKIFILTWKNRVAFIYDAETLEYESSWTYPREGWGLTTDGKDLIASDGSSRLYYLDKEFNKKKVVNVTLDGEPVRMLNELEWIDGKIWANVYLTDNILIIDPSSGVVEAVIDCKGLLPSSLKDRRTDVLNGIAFNPENGRIYLTGKYWKRLYEIELLDNNDAK